MENNNPFSFRGIITSIFRKKNIAVTIAIFGIFSTYIAQKFQTPEYIATAKMLIKAVPQATQDFYVGLGAHRIHRTQMAIVRSEPVLRLAIEALNLKNRTPDYEKNFCNPIKFFLIDYKQKKYENLLKNLPKTRKNEFLFMMAKNNILSNLTTELLSGTDIFAIRVTDYSPTMAVWKANVLSRAYTIIDQQQQLAELTQRYGKFHPSVVQLEDNIKLMTERLSGEQLTDLSAIGTASVKIIEQATTDYTPIGRPKIQLILFGLIGSIIAGIGIAFAYDYFIDQTFKAPDDIVKSLNIPLIGSLPKINTKKKSLWVFDNAQTDYLYDEYIDDLTDQLYVFIKNLKLQSILVTSSTEGEGTTSIIANIAVLLSKQFSIKTLVIDLDLINPSIHKIFNTPQEPGIAQFLTENTNSTKKEKILLSSLINHIYENLDIITAGNITANLTNLINETSVNEFINNLKNIYQIILIDSANIRNYRYVEKISQTIDGTVFIISAGDVKKPIIGSIISAIRRKNANIVGAILNNREFPIPDFIYKRL